jgi:hypothetical protein
MTVSSPQARYRGDGQIRAAVRERIKAQVVARLYRDTPALPGDHRAAWRRAAKQATGRRGGALPR